jgi:hypothetical protein
MAMGCRVVPLVETVRIHQRRRERKSGRALVVVDHDHIDAGSVGLIERFVRHRPAIDGDDQAAALSRQSDQRLARRAIPLEQTIGDVVPRLDPEVAQEQDEQGRARRSVDIVIAEDGDRLARQHRLDQAVRGGVHVTEDRRIGKECPQGGSAVTAQVIPRDPSREEQLSDQIVARRGLTEPIG